MTAIQGYLDQLAQEGLLEQGQNTAYIDVESTKIWLASKVTKDNLENLANEMANCTKTLLRIVEALENEMNNCQKNLCRVHGRRELSSDQAGT